MKAINRLIVLMAVLLSVSLFGCNAEDSVDTTSKDSTSPVTEVTPEDEKSKDKTPKDEKPVIQDVEELGEGISYLRGPGGDSKNGDTVHFFVSPDTWAMQIGLSARDMDGSKLSYIYVDGKLVKKQQMGDYDGSIDLSEHLLDPGIHQVIVKQFDDNTEEGNLVYQHAMQYEIENT